MMAIFLALWPLQINSKTLSSVGVNAYVLPTQLNISLVMVWK